MSIRNCADVLQANQHSNCLINFDSEYLITNITLNISKRYCRYNAFFADIIC